jgi:hypothetical protein
MLLQSKHLHASGGMHIGDPVLQFRAHARQNLLLYPEYLAVISSFQKHWSASLCVNTVPSPTVPSCEAGHPTTVHSVPPAVVPSCEVSKSSHGQQCAHHQHSMSALLTKDSEGQGRPGGRILWEEASFPEAGRDGLQLLTSGSSQPVGAATALSSELGALAVLRTPGTLLPVKLPLPECPFKDVALQLRDIQDAVERGRLSGQQFRYDHSLSFPAYDWASLCGRSVSTRVIVKPVLTVAPLVFQTLFPEFLGALTHQTCACTPQKWVKHVNIWRC